MASITQNVYSAAHFISIMSYCAQMKDIILSRLGKSLKDLRRRRGLTQQEVAVLARLPREKVVRLEQGRGSTALEAYVALAHALGAEFTLTPVQRPTLEEISEVLGDE